MLPVRLNTHRLFFAATAIAKRPVADVITEIQPGEKTFIVDLDHPDYRRTGTRRHAIFLAILHGLGDISLKDFREYTGYKGFDLRMVLMNGSDQRQRCQLQRTERRERHRVACRAIGLTLEELERATKAVEAGSNRTVIRVILQEPLSIDQVRRELAAVGKKR